MSKLLAALDQYDASAVVLSHAVSGDSVQISSEDNSRLGHSSQGEDDKMQHNKHTYLIISPVYCYCIRTKYMSTRRC